MFNTQTAQEARELIDSVSQESRASVILGQSDAPVEVYEKTIDLTLASSDPSNREIRKIGFPFKSIFVRSATDSITKLSVKPNTDDDFQSGAELRINDSAVFPRQLARGYLDWDAQPGKSVTLLIFVSGEFRSGSQLSLTAGGTSISDGSAFDTAVVTLTPATPSLIFINNPSRKTGTFENDTGADVFIGGSTVSNTGATKGFRVANGAIFTWQNTAALYGYSALGADIVTLEQS